MFSAGAAFLPINVEQVCKPGSVLNDHLSRAAVADALTAAGYKLLSAQVEMIPQNGYIKLTNEDDIKNMQKMLDMFEDNDDVQNVWHNWEDAE